MCFVHPIFRFLILVTFDEKISKYYLIFVYILQGKMGKMEKNHVSKVTKIPKTKRQKYGMNKTYITPLCFWKCKLGERAVGFERKKVTKIMMNYLLQRWKTVVESKKKTSFVVIISQHIFHILSNKAEQNRWKGDKKTPKTMFSFFVVVVMGSNFSCFWNRICM